MSILWPDEELAQVANVGGDEPAEELLLLLVGTLRFPILTVGGTQRRDSLTSPTGSRWLSNTM